MPHIKLTQDTHLFTGTLADNLRLADPSADATALGSALDAVEAGWFRALPAGRDTPAEEADLDQARLQQLVLARVLLCRSEPELQQRQLRCCRPFLSATARSEKMGAFPIGSRYLD